MIYPAKKIFIVLGSACNLSCRYCIQHPVVNTPCPVEVDIDVIKWIDDIAEKRTEKLEVCFYGGEPLLYFDAIREIVGLRQNRNIHYSIITNGRALTREMVNFMNAYDFRVAVSWDGSCVKDTRGYDVVRAKLDLLLDLKNLCLTGVVSEKNYPWDILKAMQTVDDVYFPIHRHHIGVNLDFIFGVNLPDPSLADVDTEKLSNQMREVLKEYDKYARSGEADPCIVQWVTRYLENYMQLSGEDFSPYCKNGLDILNVDLAGNLYLCHNCRTIVGNIHEPTVRYVDRMKSFGNVPARKAACDGCPVRNLCGQYCKLVPENAGEEHWCRLRRAVLGPVAEYIEHDLAAMAVERSGE